MDIYEPATGGGMWGSPGFKPSTGKAKVGHLLAFSLPLSPLCSVATDGHRSPGRLFSPNAGGRTGQSRGLWLDQHRAVRVSWKNHWGERALLTGSGSITVPCASRRGWRPPWPASASCLSALMVTLNGVPQQPGIGGLLLLGSLLSLHRLMVLQLDCLKRRESYGPCPRGLYGTAGRELMSDGGLPRTLQRGVLGAGWG